MAVAAPAIVAEMSVWVRLGGRNSGIVGDSAHNYGFHRSAREVSAYDYSRSRDPNGSNGPYTNWNYACAGDFWHGGRTTLRARHATVLKRLMTGYYPMLCEFIGQPYAGRPVYYWFRGDGRTRLTRYTGQGHDSWSHFSWYRSRAGQRPNMWGGRAIAPVVPGVFQPVKPTPSTGRTRAPTFIPAANASRILNSLGWLGPTHASRPKTLRLQAVMKAVWGWTGKVDGTWGPTTKAGVVGIQKKLAKYGIRADGALSVIPDLSLFFTAYSTPKLVYIQAGTNHPLQVRRAQALLNLFRGNLTVDGVYGSRSVEAAKRFQRSMRLPITGAIDTDDWAMLIGGFRWR